MFDEQEVKNFMENTALIQVDFEGPFASLIEVFGEPYKFEVNGNGVSFWVERDKVHDEMNSVMGSNLTANDRPGKSSIRNFIENDLGVNLGNIEIETTSGIIHFKL